MGAVAPIDHGHHVVSGANVPTDILVFERTSGGFALIGGSGRGARWAGIVDVSDDEDSILRRAWASSMPARISGRRAQHAAGPYYARHAVAVAVGDRHVVVLGAERALRLADTEVMRLAAATVDRTQGVPADKLLADELELVHTLRALMAYRPETVRDTLRHIATVAAGALSCEIAVIRVDNVGGSVVESIGLGDGALGHAPPPDQLPQVEDDQPRVEQAIQATLFPGTEIVSRLSLPLGSRPAIGVLSLAHAAVNPRGFTSLCQRIGRAIAEAAELLITQAAAREELAGERDRLARASLTDALTGVANRRAWDEEAERPGTSGTTRAGFVVTCDLDDLKRTNDRHGHAAGDELLRATASVLVSSVRASDLVARIGGDEFAVLLEGADLTVANRVRRRIRRAERHWRGSDGRLTLALSIGIAPVLDGDVEATRQTADRRMYANKRRRARRAGASRSASVSRAA